VLVFFDAISASTPHIYTSALPLSPKNSIVRKVYGHYARPSVRVVHGLPISWDPIIATSSIIGRTCAIAWSPCNKFIAITDTPTVGVLDAVTLKKLNDLWTLNPNSKDGVKSGLSFSPDSRFLTVIGYPDLAICDLQTSRVVGATPCLLPYPFESPCAAYSTDRRMFAVADRHCIVIHHFLSMAHVRTLPIVPEEIVNPIWTEGEYLRFATVGKPGSITVWQVPFDSTDARPARVESLPIPEQTPCVDELVFLPSRSRLAFSLGHTIFVWDAKASEFLLNFKPSWDQGSRVKDSPSSANSFSSDGRFFVWAFANIEVHVWKESPPDGYLLHQRLEIGGISYLSPNGESIINFGAATASIHLLRTQDRIVPDPARSPTDPTSRDVECFHLKFSPDETLVAFKQTKRDEVTVLDLQSGNVRLTIDAGMEIKCVGLTETTIVVAGEEKIVTCSIPVGDYAIDCTVNTRNSVQTAVIACPPLTNNRRRVHSSRSISPDLSYLAVISHLGRLEIYDTATGAYLTATETYGTSEPWFAPSGREVWVGKLDSQEGWRIVQGGEPDVVELEVLEQTERPPRGFMGQESPCGYRVTYDGWVVNPTEEQILWLPHHWRSGQSAGKWGTRFLAFQEAGRRDIVILEFLK
jgi:WD40 repeat protein